MHHMGDLINIQPVRNRGPANLAFASQLRHVEHPAALPHQQFQHAQKSGAFLQPEQLLYVAGKVGILPLGVKLRIVLFSEQRGRQSPAQQTPFVRTIEKQVPGAAIVHDKFHVSKYLGEAVDKVRRAEHKELMAQGDETLKGTRQLWLYNPENFSPEQREEFCGLKDLALKVGRAWAAKELFSKFWNYQEEGWARRFFKDWFGWVSRSQLKPLVEVAQMLKRHLDNLLTYLKHPITNAVTEGLNSKIQSLKSAARGFRNFRNYRVRILFFCGKLNLYPL